MFRYFQLVYIHVHWYVQLVCILTYTNCTYYVQCALVCTVTCSMYNVHGWHTSIQVYRYNQLIINHLYYKRTHGVSYSSHTVVITSPKSSQIENWIEHWFIYLHVYMKRLYVSAKYSNTAKAKVSNNLFTLCLR